LLKLFFTQLDDTIDLGFKFTGNQSAADIAIFLDTEITIDSAEDTLGFTVTNENGSNGYF